MKVYQRWLRIETRTSVLDGIEDSCEDSFTIRKGEKIAMMTSPTSFEIIVEMERDGKVIANWCKRIAVVVEDDMIVNLHSHIYKIDGYKHDIVDECMYEKMIDLLKSSRCNIDEALRQLKSANVVAIKE